MKNFANSDLTAAQRRILAMPLDQHLAVKGIAGSGKTVLAIKRIKKILETKKHANILFIVFNKTLQNFIENVLYEEGIVNSVTIVTFHKWFLDNFKEKAGFNWDSIGEKLTNNIGNIDTYDYIVVDECQDLGLPIFEAFDKCGAVLSIFGDNSQRIRKQASEIELIHETLNFTERAQKLNENYRNGRFTVEVAKNFCTTENASFLSGQVVRGDGQKPAIRRFNSVDEELKFIRNICIDFGQNKSIGIIVDSPNYIRMIYEAIKDIQGISIQRFYQELFKDDRNAFYNFSIGEKGVTIVNYSTCKGLEFDYVILPFLDKTHFKQSSEDLNKLYVAITRTYVEGRLYFTCCRKERAPFVLNQIPSEFIEEDNTEVIETPAINKDRFGIPDDDLPF